MGADLHVHSNFSDGSLTPQELVLAADQKGLSAIAITDHDTVAGIDYALEAAAGLDLEVIPGVEFSAYTNTSEEVHILGYFIDYRNSDLKDKLKEIYRVRKQRAWKMIELLQEQGIDLDFEDIKNSKNNCYIGRPHIARALLEKGYISQFSEAFTDKYIGNGSRAYISKFKMNPATGIEMVLSVGGIPVLAHPGHSKNEQPLQKEYIAGLKEKGLSGIEVFHSRHSYKQEQYYKKCADELGLLLTGGSDFHGENSPQVKLGDVVLPDQYFQKLKAAVK